VAWRPRPPGWPWLLAHEMRLLWRGSGGRGLILIGVLCGILSLVMHVLFWFAMRKFNLEAVLRAGSGLVIWMTALVFFFMLSAAFALTVSALFTRGDMDLLLSSPVPISNLYAMRGISIGVTSVALLVFLWMPIANMGAAAGHWGALAAYPVIVAMGLLCAALALAGTLALVRWLGVRRARVTAQVVGAVAGAFLVLSMQIPNLLPQSTQAAFTAWTVSLRTSAWFGPQSVLTWPARALFGDPMPMIAMLAVCLGAFALVVRLTTEGFANALQEGTESTTTRSRARGGPRDFRGGLARIVIAKELALIARDPMIIAKSLLQLLYLVPLMVVMVRRADLAAVMAGSLVVLSSNLAGTFAWLTVSGEEAPDLVQMSPVSEERVRWLKVSAALLPVAVVLVPFLAWFAWLSVSQLVIVTVFASAGLASAAVIQVWTGKPGQKRDMRARMKQNVAMNFIEGFCGVGWGVACYCAMTGSYKLMVPALILGFAGPSAAWLARRWLDRG
jgi:ABC-2 type transport system permease protein